MIKIIGTVGKFSVVVSGKNMGTYRTKSDAWDAADYYISLASEIRGDKKYIAKNAKIEVVL